MVHEGGRPGTTKTIADQELSTCLLKDVRACWCFTCFQEQRKLTAEQLGKQLQRDPTLVRRHVEQLLESGLVASQGQGRGRAYTLSQRVYAAFDQAEAYRQQVTLSPEEIDRLILELAGSVEALRRKDVLEALSGLESRQATYALQRLFGQGRLIPFGSGKGRHYELPP